MRRSVLGLSAASACAGLTVLWSLSDGSGPTTPAVAATSLPAPLLLSTMTSPLTQASLFGLPSISRLGIGGEPFAIGPLDDAPAAPPEGEKEEPPRPDLKRSVGEFAKADRTGKGNLLVSTLPAATDPMEGGDEIYVETDPFLPDDGSEPLARLSRRLEPAAPAGPFEHFRPSRLDAALAVAMAERLQLGEPDEGGPDGAVPIDHSLAPVGGTSPAASDPRLASLDRRTTGEAAVPVEVAALEPALPEPVITLATVHPTAEEDSGAPMPVLGNGDLDRRRKALLAGSPGYDDGVARPLQLADAEQEKALGCLATAIYFEARGESETGQIAVGQVVINRLRSPFYPKSVCDVVYQGSGKRRWGGCQFSFACDGIADRITEPGPWRQAVAVARRVMAAQAWLPDVGNATHYHADYVSPRWRRDMVEKDRIGKHIFYRVRWWG